MIFLFLFSLFEFPWSESLRRFAVEALGNSSLCRVADDKGPEDVEMGHCLKNVGVTNVDSRDNYGRFRFLPFPVESHVKFLK